jgi:hypothetical protein
MVSFTIPPILIPFSPSPPIPLLHLSPLSSRHNELTLFSHNAQTTKKTLVSPLLFPKNRDLTRSLKLRSQLRYPIISPDDHWGTWAALFATGAFGLWYSPSLTSIDSSVCVFFFSQLYQKLKRLMTN